MKVCRPAASPVCAGVITYGDVPPAGVITADPVLLPLHSTLTWLVSDAVRSADGSVIVTLTVVVHPLLSVTVKVCSPAASPVCAGAITYGDVPPAGVITADPVLLPLHSTLTWLVTDAVKSAAGSVIVTSTVAVHPLLSVTVKVCSPAASPVCAGVITYGNVPPAGAITADPVLLPLHSTLTWLVSDAVKSAAGSVIVTLTVAVHPLLSVTVKVCRPAASPVCAGMITYGDVPPAGVITADPVLLPLHSTLTWLVSDAVKSAAGSVIVTSTVAVHPLLSVTVKVCSPAASPVCAGMITYGDVPPAGVITADPVLLPLQSTLTWLVSDAVRSAAGSVIVTLTVVVHPLLSVTVNVCSPADSPVCAGVITYGDVPPAGAITADPVLLPLHSTLTWLVSDAVKSAAGSVIVTLTVAVHPLLSVTVKVCRPAASPVCAGMITYGDVPPAGVITADPVLLPLHSTLTWLVSDAVRSADGSVMVTLTVVVHPLLSVTVKVCRPAASPVCAGAITYGDVPPAGAITADPVLLPLQSTLTWLVSDAVKSADGSVIVTLTVVVHPLLSVTVNVCKPAASPVCAGVITYGDVPPAGVITADPVLLPLQSTLTWLVSDAVRSADGSVIVTLTVAVHPLLSVTVKVCRPAASPVCAGAITYGDVPPAGAITADPVLLPLQSTLTWLVSDAVKSADGSVIVTLTVVVHPLLSVTVNVCKPAASPVCAGVITYGDVPPAGVITADPVLLPLQSTLTWLVSDAVRSADGSVIVTLTVAVHPLLSVTVNVCKPAASPVCAGVITYGDVPPAGAITADPVLLPLHNTLTWLVSDAVRSAAGSVIVTLTVVVHPLLSVTVNVCSPAASPVCAGVITYGDVPPAGVITADPVLLPLQSTLTWLVTDAVRSAAGSVIVTLTVAVHPLLSVTVKVCRPAASPVCAGVITYGDVPPAGAITADPVLLPLHSTLTWLVSDAVRSADGSVIVTLTVVVHPLLSVTVNVCKPAASPVCAGVITYGDVPPAGVITADPVLLPLQSTLTWLVSDAVRSAAGSVMVTLTVAVHPLLSVTVNICKPAASPVCAGVITYGDVPPARAITADPVLLPLHSTLTWLVSDAVRSAAGSVIVTLTVVVHPLLSVTVKVCRPAASPVCAGVITYGDVPPAGAITADPVLLPLHSTLTWLVSDAVRSADGSVMVTLTVVVHPLLSVTVKVCSPAASPVCAGVITYGDVPPAGVITADPVLLPLHSTLTWLVSDAVRSADGSVIVTLTVVVHPLLSVTVKVCSPAASPVCAGAITYGDVPPAGVITADPVLLPLHSTLTWLVSDAVRSADGSVIVTLTVVVHPLLSVTVKVCSPAASPVCAGVITYGDVPPARAITADPVLLPLHSTLTWLVSDAVRSAAGSVIVTLTVVVHPLLSVTVNVCKPAASPVCAGVITYGDVPPAGVITADPVLLPLQSTLTWLVSDAVRSAAGSVIVTLTVAVHPLLSVTVKICSPAASPVCAGVITYGDVPPAGVITADPVLLPLHSTLTWLVSDAVRSADGSVIVTSTVAVHPLLSVTVKVCSPAASPVCAGVITYGDVPPAGAITADPVLLPLHSTLTWLVSDAVRSADGSVIVTLTVAVHPLLSVTVKVCSPAASPVCAGAITYGDVPPAGVITADPVLLPLHSTLTWLVTDAVKSAAGSVIVTSTVAVHPLLSVTVKVCSPAASPVCAGVITYGNVPPAGAITADPVLLPLHSTLTWLVSDAVKSAAGSVIVTLTVVVHPLLSVTVKVCSPAASPVCAGVITYGDVPPAGAITADPVLLPLQSTLTWLVSDAVRSADGSVIVTLTIVVHPLLSVTVKVCRPAASPVCAGVITYGDVPPAGAITADPVLLPLHSTLTWLVSDAVRSAAGSVMVTLTVVVHPLLSVTVKVCSPAASPVCAGVITYGDVPPAGAITADPVLLPLHSTLTWLVSDAVKSAAGSVIVTLTVAVHPLLSVTVKVCRPAASPVCAGMITYGDVPPAGVITADPVLLPLHSTLTWLVSDAVKSAAGSVIVTSTVAVHPLLSVTVKVCSPAASPVCAGMITYGDVPPAGVITADPVLLPLHSTLTWLVSDAVRSADGSVIVTLTVAVHPLLSVTVKVCSPAASPVCAGVITYGDVPPAGAITADPVLLPLHSTLTWLVSDAVKSAAGSVIVTLTVAVHPLLSVTVKVCRPAASPVCAGMITYGDVPPAGVITADPVLLPLHSTLTWLVSDAVRSADGSVMVTLTVVVHPLLSVTVKVCRPAASPVCAGVITYGDVPPAGEITADPVLLPLHSTLTWLVSDAVRSAAASVMVIDSVSVHPLAVVTVTV